MKIIYKTVLVLTLLIMTTACGGETQNNSSTANQNNRASEPQLTEFQLEHGIGPVTSVVDLGELNMEWVEEGRQIFEMKCEMCHTMNNRIVGPPLGDIMERRSAAFVMNMILNPQEMTNKHPEGQRLLREYMTIMPFQNVQRDQARAIVEYLRTQSSDS